MNRIVPVILCGGAGSRLAPLSRPDRPKPFLPLLGERSLLRATFDRVLPLLDGSSDVVVVVDRFPEPLIESLHRKRTAITVYGPPGTDRVSLAVVDGRRRSDTG